MTMRALSLRQPWCDAVLFGGKRIENRVKWKNSHYRDEFLIHASDKMSRPDYLSVVEFIEQRHITHWHPNPPKRIVRGAIVGRAKVVGVVKGGMVHEASWSFGECTASKVVVRELTAEERRWWMGGFALVLSEVVPFAQAIPHKGMLGFFRVPFDRDGQRADNDAIKVAG